MEGAFLGAMVWASAGIVLELAYSALSPTWEIVFATTGREAHRASNVTRRSVRVGSAAPPVAMKR